MRNISFKQSKWLGGFIFLLCLCSCQLNETPFSSIYTSTFYRTAEDAEAALTSVYSSLADLYAGPAAIMVPDFSADQVYPRPVVGRDTYTLFNYDVNYTTVKSYSRTNESPVAIWSSCYSGIEKINWILDKVPNTNMDATRRSQIIAESHFLRAFFLWTLTRNFGDVVIKTNPSNSLDSAYLEKSSQKDVYKQIYSDLDEAEPILPDYAAGSMQKGRPSKQVVEGLYAKAALYNEDWTTALSKAQLVLTSGLYKLMDDVRDVYDVSKEDEARQENMWAFEEESTSPGRSSQLMSLYGPKNADGPEYGQSSYGSIFAYQSFFDSFDPKDARRQLLDTNYIDRRGNLVAQKDITPITTHGVLVKKYQDPNSVGGSAAVNIPILRLADIYLIAAEAENELNGPSDLAYSYINKVRERARISDLQTGLSKEAFLDSVLQERSWELFAEGDRWYDLTRRNRFLDVIPKAVNDVFPTRAPEPKHRYFPIPLDEINANPKLEQNPDWK